MAMSDAQRLRTQALMENYGMGSMGGGGGESVSGAYEPPQQNLPPSFMDPRQVEQPTPSGLQQIGNVSSQLANVKVNPNQSLDDTIAAINRVYTPETRAGNRFNDLLDNAPVREAPGVGRSIVAAMLSLKADDPLKTADDVLYAPHKRNMQDWTAKTTPFGQAAQYENTANVNERTLAGNVVTSITQANRLAEQQRQAEEKIRVVEQKNRIQAAKNAGLKPQRDGDRWIGWGPNGERVDLGPSGGMDRADELILEGQNRTEAARAGAGAAMDRTVAGGWTIVQDQAGNRFQMNEVTGETRPLQAPTGGGSGPSGPVTKLGTSLGNTTPNATQRIAARNERLTQAYENIQGSEQVIERSSTGKLSLIPRPTKDPQAQAIWDFVKKEVDPDYTEGSQPVLPPKPPGIVERATNAVNDWRSGVTTKNEMDPNPHAGTPRGSGDINLGPGGMVMPEPRPAETPGAVGTRTNPAQPPPGAGPYKPSTTQGLGPRPNAVPAQGHTAGAPVSPAQTTQQTQGEQPTTISRAQAQAEIKAGTKVEITKNGQTFLIPYTVEQVEEAIRQGYRVKVGGQ